MQKTIIRSAETDAWNGAEGMSEGKPSLLRYRPGLKALLGDSRYPRLLSIVWRYEETDSSGMPNDSQSEEMRNLEDALQSCLDGDRAAILAFVRTGSGLRTWCYYIQEVAEISERINRVLEPGLPIQLEVMNDPEWQSLRTVYEQCGEEY